MSLVNMCAMTCEWVMAHMWMSHGTNVNESSCYESSCSYVRHDMWVSHGTYINESWHIREWVILLWVLLCICAPWHVSESWHKCEWVMAQMWTSHLIMSHLVHMCAMTYHESWHRHWRDWATHLLICEWVMAHMWMSHGAHINKTYVTATQKSWRTY